MKFKKLLFLQKMMENKDLIQEKSEPNYGLAKNSFKLNQFRRFSVFSKSFDPELGEFNFEPGADFESKANKKFEILKYSLSIDRHLLKRIMSKILLFKHLSGDDLDTIIECMFERVCLPNEIIIRQGDPGNYFYIIVNGVFEVFTSQLDQEIKLAVLSDQDYFGDLALLHNQPRSASVICNSGGLLLCINRDKFQKQVISISFERRKNFAKLLESMAFLRNSLSEIERYKVVDALESRLFNANETIFNQNDLVDGMYFIEFGQVKITQLDQNGNEQLMNVLGKGDYFGELALIKKSNRTATASCLCKCKLAFLDVNAFERLMGPCLELIEKHKIDYYKEFK